MWVSVDTGMKLSEVARLMWSDIDFDNRTVIVRTRKDDEFLVAENGTAVCESPAAAAGGRHRGAGWMSEIEPESHPTEALPW